LKRVLFISLLAASSACVPQNGPPASAADVVALGQRMDAMNKRIATLEQAVGQWSKTIEETEKLTRQGRADQSVLIEDIRNEVKTLKGQLEVFDFDFKKEMEGQKKYREDVDLRLSELEQKLTAGRAAPPPASAPSTAASNAPVSKTREDDMTRYNKILRIFRDKKDYDTAISQFQAFLTDYPKSRYGANAQYWIAESYYAKREHATAISEFQKVVTGYPKSDKVCDAILKQGYGFAELKDANKAKLFLTEAKTRCPGTSTATKAQHRMDELARAGTTK
jgi:tol-pal system protein YbgF